MIDLKDITKVYLVGEEEVCALDHVTMHVYPGDFVSVIGPSGSGKSTLMNVVGCLDTADAGNYVLDGIPIEFYSDNKLAEVRNRKIGFVFQNFNLITNMTVEENIELPLIYRGMRRSERVEKVKAAVAAVGLQTRVHHLPTELSGGQQQRVAIARAIVTEPSLILADEPTGNMDSHTSADIIEIFKKLNALGNTIVLITHDPDIAAQAKRVIRIKDGKVSEVKANGNS